MTTGILIAGKVNNSQAGFTYVLILVALLVVGILAEIAYIPNQQKIKRDKETELMFRGMAYQKAIQSYYEMNPSNKRYPRRLQDLLQDKRVAHARHIRQLYDDPFATGDEAVQTSDVEWILLRNKSGGITGVASSSEERPLKQMNFPYGYELFENAGHYSEWLFEYRPGNKVQAEKNRL